MPGPWQRILCCTSAALLALLLTGCEVHGTIDVKSGTQAEANLIFTDAEVDCLGLTRYAGLVIKGSPESDGNQTCRAQGTIELDALKDFGIELSQTGEYLMLDLAMPQQYGYLPTQVDVTFPGRVLDASGSTVSGTTVTISERSGTTAPGRARLVALSHPGPEWWVLALVGGVLLGVILTLGVLLLVRRRRRLLATVREQEARLEPGAGASSDPQPAAGQQDAAPSPPGGPGSRPAFGPGDEPRQTVRDPDYEAMFAEPPPGMEAPAARALTPPPPPAPVPVTPDHEMWAPPGDGGDR